MLVALESIAVCFVLLIVCAIGIANGPVGCVFLYEKDVQERVVELGLITKAKIKKNYVIASIAMMVPIVLGIPAMVYFVNGAREFWDLFWQMAIILWVEGLFDRLFIDLFWVQHTKAWFIPGTEDLMPYIPRKKVIMRWIGTIFFYPIGAAILAAVLSLF